MIYGRYTKKAETALIYARDCAQAFGHTYIGTEHILWGLAKEGSGVAASVLLLNNVSEEAHQGEDRDSSEPVRARVHPFPIRPNQTGTGAELC
jgi:ATP-dependent Clp protease ATP-binding subunit ClpA